MGRVTNQTPSPTAPPSSLNHFSHPHDLHPIPTPTTTLCSGCRLPSSALMYACMPCSFILHQSCAKLPRLITHPSHRGCHLSLLTTASYPGGVFNCDACKRNGDGWSYHCSGCDYDLHVTCASKPLKVKHHAHTSCELHLTFKNPYPDSKGFCCDVCRCIGSKGWLYSCNTCHFDVHLHCVATSPPPSWLQHHHSFPAATPPPPHHHHHHHHHNPLTHHSSSTGSDLSYSQQSQLVGQGRVNGLGQGYGSGSYNQMQMQAQGGGGVGSKLMMGAMQGFVEGACQGVGQAVVQGFIGGSGGGN